MASVLSRKLIGVAREFIAKIRYQHIDSKTAMAVLLPLASVNGNRDDNLPEVELYMDDLADILKLPKAYNKRGNLNAYIRKIYEKAMLVHIDSVPIIDCYQVEAGILTVRFQKEVFDEYFQGFKKKQKSYHCFVSDDIARLTGCAYTWDFMKIFTYAYTEKDGRYCEERITTNNLRRYLGLEDAYNRNGTALDRSGLEQKVIREAIAEIAEMEGFQVYIFHQSDSQTNYFKKEYNHDGNPRKRNTVRNYLFKVKRLSVKEFNMVHNIQNNNEMTDEEMEEIYNAYCDCYK